MYAYLALAALQTVGGFQSADIIRQNGDLSASVNDMNAKYADIDAHNALEAGYTNAARYQNTIDATVGADKTAYASEGVSVGYGTAGDVTTDNKIAGMVNTLQIQRSARDQARGFEGQAINIRLGGQMTRLQSNLNANAAQSSGMMQAISTGVSGYDRYNTTGKGSTGHTGSDAKPWQSKTTTVNATPDGNGMTSKYAGDDSDLGWYSRGKGDSPGFFGHSDQVGQWKPMSAQGDFYWDTLGGNHSFTSETGG